MVDAILLHKWCIKEAVLSKKSQIGKARIQMKPQMIVENLN